MWRTRSRGRDPVRIGDEVVPDASRAATPDGQRAAANMIDQAPCPQVCQREPPREGSLEGIFFDPCLFGPEKAFLANGRISITSASCA
jgi:hypothetical protein